MRIKYPLLLPTIGHGSTDLLEVPSLTLTSHFTSFFIIKFSPIFLRKILLVTSSIIHINRDIPYYINLPMHALWLKFPIIAKCYLSFYHTPLHYINTFYLNPTNFISKILLSIIVTIFLQISLEKKLYSYFNKKFGELWWVSPILAHIYITEKLYNL